MAATLVKAADMTLRSTVQDSLSALAACTRFYSRLPVPRLPWESDPHGTPDFTTMPRMLPFTGAILGCIAAAVLAVSLSLGLGPWLSATLAITALTLVTGALHEDGLADSADSLGGATPERRLEIMKDSRIGAFGASALILAFALRITALGTLAERLDILLLAAMVIAVGAVSRTGALLVLTLLPPARIGGASYAFGQPTWPTLAIAAGLAALLAFVLGAATSLPMSAVTLSLAFAAGASLLMTLWSAKLLGGQTGDIGGATQQACEIAAFVGVLIAVRA